MAAPGQHATSPAGLLGKLLAAVRREFRADILVPDPDDPVLAGGNARQTTATGPAPRTGSAPLTGNGGMTAAARTWRCSSPTRGRCMRHRSAWEHAGCPDPAAWASQAEPPAAQPRAECLLPFCTLWTENADHQFCKAHDTRWRQLGSPDPGAFVEYCMLRGRARIDFRDLPAQLRLEMQYAVQCRRDAETITLPHQVAGWAIRQARDAGVNSLLDLSEEQ